MNRTTLYVSNLPYEINDTELTNMFANYGEVKSAKIIVHRPSGRSRGFGFVEMSEESQATKALETMNGSDVGGRTIKVAVAHKSHPEPKIALSSGVGA